MRKRVVGILLIGGLLAGCSLGSTQCDAGGAPEKVIVDASFYVEEGSELQVCLRDDSEGGDACNEPGTPWVGMSFSGEYPETLRYGVIRIVDGTHTVLVGGEYEMQCEEQVVRIEVGKLESDA
jgi:hypothetical protein